MRIFLTAAALLLLLSTPAHAHGPRLIGPEALPYAWTVDPLVIVPLLLVHWLYGRGLSRIWARAGTGRGVRRSQVACFFAGELALVLALVWPLDALGETLFSAHMAQHMMLTVVAAPLLILGAPLVPLLQALPGPLRQAAAGAIRWNGGRSVLGFLTRPAVAAVIQVIVLWVWHAPGAFQAALASPAIHVLEHATFFGSALLFWWSIIHASRLGPMGYGIAAFWMLVTVIQGGFLGALITFARTQLYPRYGDAAMLWGMDALADQQLAGLVMWVPSGMVHIVAGVMLIGAWLSALERHNRHAAYAERYKNITEPS